MSQRPLLHLIDGSGYIFRAYYAVRPLSTRAGLPTNAVVGFARMLIKLLREEAPRHLGIAFDTAKANFRHAIYTSYKANRELPPEDLAPQFGLIHQLVESMDIPIFMHDGFEADDLLASLTRQAIAAGYDVVLVSADKDLMQLVGPHLLMFDPMRDKRYDRAGVLEKFGVPPEHVADLLALSGDVSDNIPGVPKVGPKSAAKLITDFGDVEAVIAGVKNLAKRRAYEQNVVDYAEQARLSKRLTVLDEQAPVALNVAALQYTAPLAAKMQPFLQSIEAFSMLRDFGLDAVSNPGKEPHPNGPTLAAQSPSQPPTTTAEPITVSVDRSTYQTILSESQLSALCERVEKAAFLSVDLETTSLQPTQADIVGVALAIPDLPPVYIPVGHRYLGVPKQLAAAQVLDRLRPILTGRQIPKVGQNLKYDWVVFHRAGIELAAIEHDAMLAAYVLDPARASYSLDALAREFLGHQTITYNEITGTGKKRLGFEEVQVEDATRYAGEDADVALRLCLQLAEKVGSANLNGVYRDIEIPLVPVLARMEAQGVQVDTVYMQTLAHEFNKRLIDIENEAFALIGAPINLGSPKQLAYLFFEKLGYPPVKKTKTGYSTDQEVLESLARTYDLPRVILNHRLLAKLKSTYVDALPKMVNGQTGRVHTSFNQTGTATGRLSSSDPNLQNIPIRSDDGRRIRGAFVAPEGWSIMSADYSQVELRLMAHLSKDSHFVEAFQNGEDIHARTAREILGHVKAPEAELRRRAKAINFGILYGLSEFGLARNLNIPRAEAHAYISAYFGRYPSIRHFLDRAIENGRRDGFVSTMSGRRRYLPNLNSKNGNIRQGAERIAMNTPIQGSAADLIKMAMLRVQRELLARRLRARLLLQVHDELVLEVPEEEQREVRDLVKTNMVDVMRLAVPLDVDVGLGANWAAAH